MESKITHSVVCPIYARKGEVRRLAHVCIDSVEQNSDDYELIIVNDGSPLYVGDLLNRADISITHRKNKGVAPSWNDGIKIARGEYIAVINSDIEVPPNWLEGLREKLNGGVGMVAPAVEHLPNDPQQPVHQWFPGSCFMLNRETIKKVGYFDEDFAPFYFEDTDYLTRILKAGLKLARNYDIFVKHAEGATVKDLARDEYYQKNLERFIRKHGFDPIPIFCGGEPYESFI